MRRRVHTSRPRVSKGSHFPHADGPGARGFDFSPRRPAKNLVLKKMHFPYVVSNKKRDFWLLAAIIGFGGPVLVVGLRRVHSSPFVRGCNVSSSGVEGFTFFVVGRRRVHIFVLGPRRVHVFRPRVREGSCFSSSGAEGFAFSVLGRRRVHIFGSCAAKGSYFSSSCVEGFTFSARGWPRRQRVRFFSQVTSKKSGAQKHAFSLRGFK